MVELPKGVRPVVRKRRTYYYFQIGRGTAEAGPSIPLPGDPTDPKFWQKLKEVAGVSQSAEGTFRHMTALYKESGAWAGHAEKTQENYTKFLNGFDAAWGDLQVADLTRTGAYAHRETMKDTPTTANHMLSVLRTFLEWCVEHHGLENNIAVGMKRLAVDEDGARPWPEHIYQFVLANAPEDLRRMAILGRACGQRRADLVKMRGIDRTTDGIRLKIGKLRDKNHMVPLTAAFGKQIDSWKVDPMVHYLLSPSGAFYSPDGLNARWGRWLNDGSGQAIKEAVRLEGVTIHGLRATAVVDRRLKNVKHDKIAAQLGMSLKMVMHYSRFCDQEMMAMAGMGDLEG